MKRTVSDRENDGEHVVSNVEKVLKTPGELQNANFPMDAEGMSFETKIKSIH